MAGRLLYELTAELIELKRIIAKSEVIPGSNEKRRVGENQVEAASGDRFKTITQQHLNVLDPIQSRIEIYKTGNPRIYISGHHQSAVSCRTQAKNSTPGPKIESGARWPANGKSREKSAGWVWPQNQLRVATFDRGRVIGRNQKLLRT
jgi:hypothetical protein